MFANRFRVALNPQARRIRPEGQKASTTRTAATISPAQRRKIVSIGTNSAKAPTATAPVEWATSHTRGRKDDAIDLLADGTSSWVAVHSSTTLTPQAAPKITMASPISQMSVDVARST